MEEKTGMPSAVTFDDYQEISFAKRNKDLSETETAAMLALGVAGEASEVADFIFHRKDTRELDLDPEFREKLKKELGDTLWYVAGLAKLYGIPLSEVAQGNVDKLSKRYPTGFNPEAAKKRADGEVNDQDVDHDPVKERVAKLRESAIRAADEYDAMAAKAIFPEQRVPLKAKGDALRRFSEVFL